MHTTRHSAEPFMEMLICASPLRQRDGRRLEARTFALRRGDTLKLDAPRGATVRVRSGDIWLTQHNDLKDHLLKTSQTLALNGAGDTIITAFEPTVLELYRQDATALRLAVERRARRLRNRAIQALFARLLARWFSRRSA